MVCSTCRHIQLLRSPFEAVSLLRPVTSRYVCTNFTILGVCMISEDAVTSFIEVYTLCRSYHIPSSELCCTQTLWSARGSDITSSSKGW